MVYLAAKAAIKRPNINVTVAEETPDRPNQIASFKAGVWELRGMERGHPGGGGIESAPGQACQVQWGGHNTPCNPAHPGINQPFTPVPILQPSAFSVQNEVVLTHLPTLAHPSRPKFLVTHSVKAHVHIRENAVIYWRSPCAQS